MRATPEPPAAPQLFRQVGADPALQVLLVEASTTDGAYPATVGCWQSPAIARPHPATLRSCTPASSSRTPATFTRAIAVTVEDPGSEVGEERDGRVRPADQDGPADRDRNTGLAAPMPERSPSPTAMRAPTPSVR